MSKAKSADLILKLYELRREEKMREARNWMITFFPESAQDITQTMMNDETSAYYRMVTSYWDMAASFVNHGAINEKMFNEVSGEAVMVFSRIEPFLEEIRGMNGSPNYLANLEKLIMRMPDAKEMLAKRREMMKRMMQARNEAAAKSVTT
ncbi:MAG: hypothetical protein LC768_00185 [Acidobacteria bacterium]|nr:hypothetical protein [Acidobacteriota bacterium]MCA1636755.1 hypothetical protein [Acidobacteriota bacterium]